MWLGIACDALAVKSNTSAAIVDTPHRQRYNAQPMTPADSSTISPLLNPRPLNGSLPMRVLLWAIVAAVYTSIVIQFSLRDGRLILPPAYDDIGYFADAAMRLLTLYSKGIWPVFNEYANHPPHAPYSTLMAMLGFLIFGIHDWAPYAINGLLLMGYLAFADHLLRGVRRWQKGLGFAVLLSVPLTVMAVHEFRPDHASALLTVIGGLVILERPLIFASLKRKAFIGLIFGLALIAKPSTFPATVAMFLGTLALGALADTLISRRLRLRQTFVAWGICVGAAAAVATPHFIVGGAEIYTYIHDNIFGYRAAIWKTEGSLLFQMTYYLNPGDDNNAGGQMVGRHVFLLFFLLLSAAVTTAFKPNRKVVIRTAAMGLFLFGTYLVVTTNPDKTVYFGLTFQTALLMLAIGSLRQLILVQRSMASRVPWAWAILIIAVVFGVLEFRWPRRIGVASGTMAVARRDIADGVYNTLVSSAGDNGAAVLIEGLGDINPDLLNYYNARDQRLLQIFATPDTDDLAVHIDALKHADMLVLSEPDTLITADFLLSYKVLPAMNEFVRHDPHWKQIGYFVYPPSRHGIYVFERRHVEFTGWSSATGLGPREGPYPQLRLPIIHWGLGPQTTLTFTAPATPVNLEMEFRNGHAVQTMTVTLDGKPLLAKTYKNSPEFRSISLPLKVEPNTPHQIIVTYSTFEKGSDLKRSVLLTKMAILPR